jgi:Zn-dependent metalloprotease
MHNDFRCLAAALAIPALVLATARGVEATDSPEDLPAPQRTAVGRTGKLAFLGVDTTRSNFPGVAAEVLTTVAPEGGLQAIAAHAERFGLADPKRQLVFAGRRGGGRDRAFALSYQQVHDRVPVLGGELVVNYDRLGRLAAISGEVSPDLSLATAPNVAEVVAVDRALAYVERATGIGADRLVATEPELWIHDERLLGPSLRPTELVWRVEVRSLESQPVGFMVLINAQRGGVSVAFNQIDTAWSGNRTTLPGEYRKDASWSAIPKTGDMGVRPFSTPDMFTYDSNDSDARQGGVDSDTGSISSTLVCSIPPDSDPPVLTGANSCDGGSSATTANAAHFFAFDTILYFDEHHSRNSIDDGGMALISNVEFTPYAPFPNPGTYANAFWDGQQMTYGNDGFFTADDVVGHELTHGVTQHSSGLYYYYESGAINEAMSDVFGEVVDLSNGIDSFGAGESPPDRWVIAEDAVSGGIRNMSDPTLFGDPDRTRSPYYYAPGGVNFDQSGDNGGVHINSGVANKAASLMADGGSFNGYSVTGIGIEKTSAVFYETNTTLLTSGSDYGVLGAALVQACLNLVGGAEGITGADCGEVDKATLATEMHLEPSAAGYSPDAAYDCPDPADTPVDLFFDDMTSPAFSTSGTYPWYIVSDYVTSSPNSLWGPDDPSVDSWVRTTDGVTLTEYETYFLHFTHAFGFEDGLLGGPYGVYTEAYDGGVVEYSTSGSAGPWIDITSGGSAFVDGLSYNATLESGTGNPIAGRTAFGYDSHGWVSSRFELTALDGSSVHVRWRIGTDALVYDLGWFVDDVRIYGCGAMGGCPYDDFVDMTSQAVTTTETFGACDTLTAGTGFAVESPGDVTFEAGNTIVLENGFSVGSGATLTAVIDPSLHP